MKYFFVIMTLALATSSVNATVLYNDRTTFDGMLGSSVTDDYENAAYDYINTDAAMSAVLGETVYQSTGFTDLNIVTDNTSGDNAYCSGCNGSFLLDFTSTSVGSASGVFGVGFDVHSSQNVFGTTAFVTFGDGSTVNYALAAASDMDYFWGITSELLISSIHFGLIDGGTNTDNSVQRMALDDLTIGNELGSSSSVPAPASVLLLGLGLLGLAANRKKV